MAFLMTYVTLKGGIAAIGKCGEVIGPLYVLVSFGPILLMLGLMDWKNLQPVYTDSGWRHILPGILPTSADTMAGVMMPLMLTAFMSSPKKVPSRALWAMGLSSLWVMVAAAVTVLNLFVGSYCMLLLALSCLRYSNVLIACIVTLFSLSFYIQS